MDRFKNMLKKIIEGDRKIVALRIIGLVLIVAAIGYFANLGYEDLLARSEQKKLQKEWEEFVKGTGSSDSSQTASGKDDKGVGLSANASYGKPLARMVIPKINLDTIVLEGVGSDVLKKGPGHMRDTARPGETGNVVLSGHRSTYGRPFYALDKLKKDDPIHVYTATDKFTYYVTEQKIVEPTALWVTDQTKDKKLTLITCNPIFSAKQRLVVFAELR